MTGLDINAACPFCRERHAPDVEYYPGAPDEAWAVCVSCLAQGPKVTAEGDQDQFDLEHEALEAWNGRRREDEPVTVEEIDSLVPSLQKSLDAAEAADPKLRQLGYAVDEAAMKFFGGEGRSIRAVADRMFADLNPKEQALVRARLGKKGTER